MVLLQLLIFLQYVTPVCYPILICNGVPCGRSGERSTWARAIAELQLLLSHLPACQSGHKQEGEHHLSHPLTLCSNHSEMEHNMPGGHARGREARGGALARFTTKYTIDW